MRATRITANLLVADVASAKGSYTGFLGLGAEEFDLVWVTRCTPGPPAPTRSSTP